MAAVQNRDQFHGAQAIGGEKLYNERGHMIVATMSDMPEPQCLEPDWNHSRPSIDEVRLVCNRISVTQAQLGSAAVHRFLESIRKSHHNGGAHLAAFTLGPDVVFDWFASRNRLSDEHLIDSLIVHPAIREALPQIQIPESKADTGLEMADPFLLDGKLARVLHNGGAYTNPDGDGREAKNLALEVCDTIFGLRFGQISLLESFEAWTPWFKGIAWDMTLVLFDRRLRKLSILAITDTD